MPTSVVAKPPLVLIHGWGLNSAVWHAVTSKFADSHEVICIDLPGHGVAPGIDDYSLPAVVSALSVQVPPGAVLVGWSLGGMLAQAICAEREDIKGLVLVASSPKFVADDHWPGMSPQVLAQFAAQLHRSVDKTISRFLAIQAMGSPLAKQEVSALKAAIDERGMAAEAALAGGLALLASVDQRAFLAAAPLPMAAILGRKDTLVPKATAAAMAELNAVLHIHMMNDASHAPFISHPDEFCQALKGCLHILQLGRKIADNT